MDEARPEPETAPGPSKDLPPIPASGSDVTGDPSSSDIGPGVTLRHGETLVVYHPHSRRPRRIVSTAELHAPHKHTTRHDIKTPQASYAPFPTRADFEQAEIFINNDCSNKLIDTQLKFGRRNGAGLRVKSSHEMHKLLMRGVEEDVTDGSKVGPSAR
jgi:hypothetical protein